MKVSLIASFDDQEPVPAEVEGLEGLGALLAEVATPEKGSTAWIAGETYGRTDQHVQAVNFWVLDFDGSEPPWDRLAGWRYIAHTSHSHMKITDSHPEPVPCWRVIVELDQPSAANEWKLQYKTKAAMHDLRVSTDGKTCNPSRIWYAPGPEAEWRVNLDGAPASMPPLAQCVETVQRESQDTNHDGLLSDGALFWPSVERLMQALPPSIAGDGGDDRLFEAACYLRSSFRLTEEAAFRALRDYYNPRCRPPWDEERLRYKVSQAANDRQHVPGELVPAQAKAQLLAAAKAADPALAERLEASAAPAEPAESPFKLISAAAMAEPLGPVDWLFQDLGIAPGRPTVLVGYAGSGKTLVAQELALSVASGEPGLMGKLPVARQGAVLHLDVDQGRRATVQRYQQLARGRGLSLASLPLDLVVFEGYLTTSGQVDPQAVVRLANACEGRALCIIDSLRGIAPGLDENSSDFGAVLQTLAAITDATERECGLACTFLVIHHEGKPSAANSKGAQYAGRGSSAIQDRAGAVWRLVQDTEAEEVEWSMSKISEHATDRAQPFRTKLLRSEGGGLTLKALGVGETRVSQARANVEHVAAKLVAKLRDADRWLSRGELLVDVAGKSADKQEAIALLKERKHVAYRLEGSKHQYHWNPKMVD